MLYMQFEVVELLQIVAMTSISLVYIEKVKKERGKIVILARLVLVGRNTKDGRRIQRLARTGFLSSILVAACS